MLRQRCHRLLTAVLVIGSLLFAQLALANYLCPGQPAATAMTMEMVEGEPCEGAETGQPALCFQHCVQAPQTADTVKVPALSIPAVVQVLLVPLVLDREDSRAHPVAAAGELLVPPDPLFLSTLRLRV